MMSLVVEEFDTEMMTIAEMIMDVSFWTHSADLPVIANRIGLLQLTCGVRDTNDLTAHVR